MIPFFDTPEGKDNIRELLRIHQEYVLHNASTIDQQVANQNSRFTKFWCWLIYGHLLDYGGKCLRCGKQFKANA